MKASEITDSMRRCQHREPPAKPRNYWCVGKACNEGRQQVATMQVGDLWYCQACGLIERANMIERAKQQEKSGNPALAPQTPVTVPLEQKPGKVSEIVRDEDFCLFTIPGAPIGKPRMTQRDKWKKRPCVMRYRAWADSARAAAPKDMPKDPVDVNFTAYLPMPKSWSAKKREAMRGQLHRQKPDVDNIFKSLADALWKSDCGIAIGSFCKRWDDGKGPRTEMAVL